MIDFQRLFPDRDLKQEWDSRLDSNDVPPVLEVPNVNVDLDKLRDFHDSMRNQQEDIYENDTIRSALGYDNHLPDNYWTLVLTTFTDLSRQLQEEIDNERGIDWREHQSSISKKKRFRSLIELNQDYDPLIDERNCTKHIFDLTNTYMSNIFNLFSSTINRARFPRIASGDEVKTHIDCNTKYNIRAHIPIYTNNGCYNGFSHRKYGEGEVHLEEGKLYIVNAGVPHWARNEGNTERIHLVIGLDGQEDLHNALENGGKVWGSIT